MIALCEPVFLDAGPTLDNPGDTGIIRTVVYHKSQLRSLLIVKFICKIILVLGNGHLIREGGGLVVFGGP